MSLWGSLSCSFHHTHSHCFSAVRSAVAMSGTTGPKTMKLDPSKLFRKEECIGESTFYVLQVDSTDTPIGGGSFGKVFKG